MAGGTGLLKKKTKRPYKYNEFTYRVWGDRFELGKRWKGAYWDEKSPGGQETDCKKFKLYDAGELVKKPISKAPLTGERTTAGQRERCSKGKKTRHENSQ